MSLSPLLIFDFDGVIADGMPEYWFSSRLACSYLINSEYDSSSLPSMPPNAFVQLRPWVEHGWEMVLLAAELLRDDSYLLNYGADLFAASYPKHCKDALKAWGWTPSQLQSALEEARRSAIRRDKDHWFSLHNPYPWVLERFNQFPFEGVEWAVLTTKGQEFAEELLNFLGLHPTLVFGHESGSKTDVLKEIISSRLIQGFVEDRRETLEKVLSIQEIAFVPCYLASWGYLKPMQDQIALPEGIRLLSPETMSAPLATWH